MKFHVVIQNPHQLFSHEVLFTSEPLLELVANGFAAILKPGDEVLVSALEHHSNIALANAL
jgi:selenocysteine lyase/cysteine desulfurase